MKLTHRSMHHVADDLRQLVLDLERLLKAVPKDLSTETEAVRERAEATMELAKETCARLEKRTLETLKDTDEIIREQPYPFMGGAFLLGLGLGFLSWRSCHAR